MPSRPVRFDLENDVLQAQTEAAAHRRLRLLENSFPAVCSWEVAARSRPAADAGGHRAHARVSATILGGDRLEASAPGVDVLDALRLAFNALEAQLHQESANARDRAFHWFEKVRSRAGHGWFGAE